MIKVFNHWFHRKTVAQVAVDLMFPVVCVIFAAMWLGRGGRLELEKVAFYAVIFALLMIVLNAWLGIYQRAHSRTREETRARAVLSLYLAIPLAYVVFALLSVAEVDRGFMLLSGLAALFTTLLRRVHSAHSGPGSLLSHRVLVFGVGEEAQRHALQMAVHLLAQVVDDALARLRAEMTLHHADPAAEQRDAQHRQGEQVQAGGVAVGQHLVDQGAIEQRRD